MLKSNRNTARLTETVIWSDLHSNVKLTQMNLQNVPARSEIGKEIRECFIAPPGSVVMRHDFKTFELVMMANFCKDPTMCSVLADPSGDLHTVTAKSVNVSRTVAKTLNFGLLYGMGPKKLKIGLDMNGNPTTLAEARRYRNRFFETYPYILTFQARLVQWHRNNGYMQNAFGRVRRVPGIDAESSKLRAEAERKVANNVIQSSCADWVKYAMLDLSRSVYLKAAGYKPVLSVHDEIVAIVPYRKRGPFSTDKVREEVSRIMTSVGDVPGRAIMKFPVPIRVDGSYAENWGETK